MSTEEGATFHTTEPPKGYTVITGPPPTVPEAVPQEVTTAAAPTGVPQEVTTASAPTGVPLEMTTAAAASEVPQEVTMEATTEATPNDTLVSARQPISTEVPEQQQSLSTHAAAPETAAPTKEAEVVQTSGTAAATTESSGNVVNQGETAGEERARHTCTGSKRRVTVIIISSRWNNGPTFILGASLLQTGG